MKHDRLISLNAAIDALEKCTDNYLDNLPPTIYKEDAIKAVRALPPATDTNVATTDTISKKAALDVLHGYFDGMLETDTVCPKDLYNEFETLPSAQSELEDKIRAIGYTGKEGRIYIGGRLFAVRELSQ